MGRDQGTLPTGPAATSQVQPLATARTRRLLMRHLQRCTCPSQAVPPGHESHLSPPDPQPRRGAGWLQGALQSRGPQE